MKFRVFEGPEDKPDKVRDKYLAWLKKTPSTVIFTNFVTRHGTLYLFVVCEREEIAKKDKLKSIGKRIKHYLNFPWREDKVKEKK